MCNKEDDNEYYFFGGYCELNKSVIKITQKHKIYFSKS